MVMIETRISVGTDVGDEVDEVCPSRTPGRRSSIKKMNLRTRLIVEATPGHVKPGGVPSSISPARETQPD
jgi:hypothetical protein